MKARIVFDTLAYANRLKAAGVESKIAEAQAEASADMVAGLLENTLATKQDLILVESKLEHQIIDSKSQMMQSIKELEIRMTLRLGGIVIGGLAVVTTILSIHIVH